MSSETLTSHSRRSFLQGSTALSAALAFRMMTEPMLAHASRPKVDAEGAVLLDSNENPLGPCTAAREAVAEITPRSGRYLNEGTVELVNSFAGLQGLKPEYVRVFAGSGDPLHFSVIAFSSAAASYVNADPGYEAGAIAARSYGIPVVNVPLTRTYAHDVRAMLTLAPNAGLFYICNPNNPTGTLTSHSAIEYLVDNKPKGSIVLVDEAYLHYCDAPSCLDLVKAGKDVIVLRTFSKIYGMAGLRCGIAIGSPDLVSRLVKIGGGNPMPVTATAAAVASLKDQNLLTQRKQVNTKVREETFAWLARNGYSYIPSVSNCFMVDAKRPAREVITAMAQQNVIIGRVWPAMPTHTRITVGTQEEMQQFQTAFENVMKGKVTVGALRPDSKSLDGRLALLES